MFQGLRTVIYPAPDLARAKAWYAELLGFAPYFDEVFYVGFNVGGFELGLVPDGKVGPAGAGVVAYWGVPDVAAAVARGAELGGTVQGRRARSRRRYRRRDAARPVRQRDRPNLQPALRFESGAVSGGGFLRPTVSSTDPTDLGSSRQLG